MLISPPFLLPRENDETDAAYVARCMLDANVGFRMPQDLFIRPQGLFPVSFGLGWHGGIHLRVPPTPDNSVLPVRAIADGEVVFARAATAQNDNPQDPRNYNPNGGSAPRWTDDGCVIIKHTTEIGANAQNQPVQVTFFSIYMHLSQLRGVAHSVASGNTQNRRIYRKDDIGSAGRIYGDAGQLHFEIVCENTADNPNLQRLIGRITGDVNTAADGRTDVIFGELYFRLPVGTRFYAERPAHNVTAPTAQPVHTLTGEPLYVGLQYRGGDGVAAARGWAFLTTYRADGATLPGGALPESNAEYNLYRAANDISRAYPAANRPAPSAVYELLRFGRVIGPDALTPADVPHWRQVRYEGGTGWVNLNAADVRKYSDADFPQWRGWTLVNDDTDTDSRCESATLTRMIEDESNADGQLTRTELGGRLRLPAVRDKLKKTICLFPSEWDNDSVQARWGWLSGENRDPEFGMDQENFDLLIEHARAIGFSWAAANIGLSATHWHFEPREFIAAWKLCGWLSLGELAGTFPKHLFYTETGNPRTAITTNNNIYTISREVVQGRIDNHCTPLNRCMRKYVGGNSRRMAIFLAQVMLETAQWRDLGGTRRLMHEWGFGAYSAANPATEFYTAFYGRGIMQLTWAGNYRDYGEFRSLPNHVGNYVERRSNIQPRINATSQHYNVNPGDGGVLFTWSPRYDPDIVAEQSYEACDSGGFYWVSKPFSEGININRVADRDYSAANVGFVNRLVNGGFNGYYERQAYTSFMLRYLSEDTSVDVVLEIIPPPPKVRVSANMRPSE